MDCHKIFKQLWFPDDLFKSQSLKESPYLSLYCNCWVDICSCRWNISTTTGWIDMELGIDQYGTDKLHPWVTHWCYSEWRIHQHHLSDSGVKGVCGAGWYRSTHKITFYHFSWFTFTVSQNTDCSWCKLEGNLMLEPVLSRSDSCSANYLLLISCLKMT